MRPRTGRSALLAAALAVLVAGLLAPGAGASITPATNTITVGAGSTGTESKTVGVPAVPPKADIEIAIDTTGSMGSAIAQAKADATNVVNGVKADIPDAQFSVVEFKDAGDSPEYLVHNPMTSDAATVQASIDSLSAGGGGDFPEAYNFVFNQAYNPLIGGDIGWRPDSRKFVVVIGDAPPHGAVNAGYSDCFDTSADPHNLNTATELANLAGAQRTLFMVAANTGTNIKPCYDQLVAGGFFGSAAVDLGANFADQLVGLIRAASAQVSNVHLEATSASSGASTSWLSFDPGSVGPVPAPSDQPFTVNVAVPAGTAPGSYTFTVAALADGQNIGDQALTVVVPSASSSTTSSGSGTTTTAPPTTTTPVTPNARATVRAALAGVPRAGCTSSRFVMRVRVRGTASRVGVRVELDGNVVARSTKRSFTVAINAKRLRAGRHVVTVVARGTNARAATKRVAFRRCAAIRPTLTG